MRVVTSVTLTLRTEVIAMNQRYNFLFDLVFLSVACQVGKPMAILAHSNPYFIENQAPTEAQVIDHIPLLMAKSLRLLRCHS